MGNLFGTWFGYGLGAGVAKAIFGEDRRIERGDPPRAPEPVRHQTEEEIRADEKRFAEDEKRIESQAKAERAMQEDKH